jgi:3-keto-disaccharide hydrolase
MKRMLCLMIVVTIAMLGTDTGNSDTLAIDSESKSTVSKDAKAINLFNGKDFTGWHMYVKGADVDPKDVWKIKDGAIWCKGDPFGFLRTTKKYGDFKLTVEWRWPEKTSNSGILLRMTDGDKIWPLCMEAQLKYKSAGDVVGMGCDFNEDKSKEGSFFRHAPKKSETNETKPGEWNKYEIVFKGDTMLLTVNGKFQNKATGIKLSEGYVGLQSEGSPIMFRNIKLTPLH